MSRIHRKLRPFTHLRPSGFWAFLVVAFLMVGVLFAPSAQAVGADPTPGSLVVKLVPGLTTEEQAAVIARNGGTETSSVPALRLHVVSVPAADLPAVLQAYQADPQVESAELNTVRKAEGAPSDQNYAYQWALPRIGWDAAFGTVVPAGTAKVALLDTGVDASHPDLVGALLPGKSMLDASNGWTDPSGHGTWMAGIVAASTNNGLGIAGVGYQGVSILPVVVLNASGLGQDSAIIEGIVWAADQGADVILMPFSNPDYSQGLQDALDYAWSKGAVLVAATGNDGLSTPTYPAGGRGVIGVSATDPNDLILPASNFGQDTFLAAPGMEILTTTSNQTYATITGTSASSAMVAGTAAFLKAVDPTLTNGVIVGRMARSADAAGVAGDPNNTTLYGNGRVNFAKALADTSLLPIQPVGVPGGGGPYVGPYTAAASTFVSVDVTPLAGSLTFGTPGAVTYTVTVTRSGSGNLDVVLSVPTVLPAGATASFSSSTVSFTGNAPTSKTSTLTINTTAATPAGSTSFNVTGASGGTSKTGSNTLVVAKATASLTLSGLNPTYDGTAKSVSVTTNPAGLSGVSVTYDGSATAPTNAGSYAVVASLTNGNYQATNATGTLVIAKAATTTTVTATDAAYDGNPHGATASVTGPGSLSQTLPVTYTGTGSTIYPASTTAPTNAGTYTASATYAESTNHLSSSDSKPFTITKAAATLTLGTVTFNYDGAPKSVSVTTNPTGLSGVSVTYDGSATAPTNAGSYAVVASLTNGNYQATNATGTLVIAKAATTTTVTATDATYDGNPHGATASVTGIGGLNQALTVTYTGTGSTIYPASTTAPTNAGTYTASATYAESTNHLSSSDSKPFTINKASSTTTVTIVGGPFTYTGSPLTPATVTVTGAGSLSLTPAADYTNNINAGLATASYTFAGDANHTGSSDSKTFTIDKASSTTTVTIVGSSFTYTGLAQTPATVTVTGAGSLSLTPAADYTNNINAGLATASYTFAGDANHTGSSDSKTFTIDKASSTTTVTIVGGPFTYTGSPLTPATVSVTGAGSLSLTPAATYADNVNAGTATASYTFAGDANHTGSSDSKTFTIDKASSITTVTIVGSSFTYTGSAQTPATVTVTGAGSLSLTPAATYADNVNAGTATASYTFAGDANHTGSSDSKTFTIDKASSTTTVAINGGPFTYTGSPLTPATVAVTGAGSLSLTPAATYADNVNAGTATASYTFAGDANHTGSTDSKTFTINKATPTATLAVSNSPQTYNGSPKAATVSVATSSVPGATANILTGGVATQTNAGTYAVTADFVPTDTTNYNTLTGLSAGNLVIEKATPTATLAVSNSPQTYNGSPKAATVSVATSSVPGTVANTLTGGMTTKTNAGTYAVTADFVPTDTANYNTLTGLSAGTFVIEKATPTATLAVNNSPQTYNGSPKAATVSVSTSSVPGAAANILTGGAAAQSNAGTYAVAADFVPTDTTNYNSLTGLSAGTFVIEKATPLITWANPADITYGVALSAAQLNASASVPGTFIYTPAVGTVLNAGPNQILSVAFAPTDTTNYNHATKAVTINVNYGFNGLLAPWDPSKSYKIKSAIPLKWQYTNALGVPVPSGSASPAISIVMVSTGGTGNADIALDDAGSSGYQYDPTTAMWQFNWKTTGLAPGTYLVSIRSGATGQVNGTFTVMLAR